MRLRLKRYFCHYLSKSSLIKHTCLCLTIEAQELHRKSYAYINLIISTVRQKKKIDFSLFFKNMIKKILLQNKTKQEEKLRLYPTDYKVLLKLQNLQEFNWYFKGIVFAASTVHVTYILDFLLALLIFWTDGH